MPLPAITVKVPSSEVSRPFFLRKRTFAAAILFVTYLVTARIGLSFYAVGGFATLVWPPTGISLAALLLWGPELWPGVLLGAFFANLLAGASPLVALGIATGNTLEALTGWWFLSQFFKFDISFGRLRDSALFIMMGAFVAPLVSATVGTITLTMSRTITSDIGATWGTWWFGDMLGALVFTPLMLTWLRGRPLGGAEPEGKTSALETVLLLSAIIGVNLFVFWSPYSIIGGVPIVYAVLFPLMWASLRFGPRGKSLAVFLTSFIAIWATVSGSGTFAQEDVRAGLMALQVFVAAVAIIFLLLASLNEERTRYRVELEKYVEKLERSLQKNRILQSRGESAPMGGEGGETVSP